ncbi:MAG: SUKH-3 domain-containing protein [Actinoplanes sp.]
MTDRFPPLVTQALVAAGWQPGTRDDEQAKTLALLLAGYATPDGQHHTIVPPAVEAWAEFAGLAVPAAEEGEEVAPSAFVLDPLLARYSVATFAALAAAIGASLSPLGEEGGGTGLLAIDEEGRVFLCDHTGEWFLGQRLEEAITALVLGLQPRRVTEEGTW